MFKKQNAEVIAEAREQASWWARNFSSTETILEDFFKKQEKGPPSQG
ncbi:MAG: hypothetical protein LBT45_00385 [Rickettsiales bacterium]|jgi:hypothetical protein|nr:hypothetical protein [Rickettsiales bacterium]